MPVKILIVGAGLAGLSAAVALARKGHEVELFEKSAFSNEVGAALHFGPTTTAYVFKEWGIDAMNAFQACKCERWIQYDVDGDCVTRRGVRFELEQRRRELQFEGDEIMCHRVDAHSHLRETALSCPKTRLHLSAAIESVDPEAGTITLKDGSIHRGDVIVGADGIHSQTVKAIAGPGCVPTMAGANIFRFFVQAEKARQHPAIAEFLDDHDYVNSMVDFATVKPGPRAVMYPARRGSFLNFGLMFPANLTSHRITTMDWQAKTTREEVLRVFHEFPQVLKDLINIGEDFKHWAFATRDPPRSFVKGRLVMIGDAAHPMHPTNATGAVQGVEDAACLGELLDADVRPQDIAERLELYNKLRYERGVTLKWVSEMGAQGGQEKRLANLRRFLPNAELPDDVDKYIWMYNPIKEAQDALHSHLESKRSWPYCTIM